MRIAQPAAVARAHMASRPRSNPRPGVGDDAECQPDPLSLGLGQRGEIGDQRGQQSGERDQGDGAVLDHAAWRERASRPTERQIAIANSGES